MNAFLFIPMLAATWALGFVLVLFAAHYFLTVLESTAAGNDQITWAEEPFIDWFWKAFYLAYLGGVWLTPMIVVGRLLTPDPWIRLVFSAGAFWLLFPIGILSSQSAESIWVPFWPGVFKRLGQRLPAVGGFYLLSIPISFVLAASIHYAFGRGDAPFETALLLAPVGAAALLVYARTLGRLGFVLSFTLGGENERETPGGRKKKKKQQPTAGEHDEQPIQAQPSELPPVETPFEGAITGYNVVFDDSPAPTTPPPLPATLVADDDNDDGRPLSLESDSAETPGKAIDGMHKPPLPEPAADEMAAWERSRQLKEPSQPYDASLVTFLFESRTLSAWLLLTAGLGLLGALVRGLHALRPG